MSSNNYLDKRELSAGLTKDLNKKIILVPYNDYEKSITILKKFKSKIAMVIIEPIQQALPSKKCEDYIKNIYNFCKSKNILICFDEMITGIRVDKFFTEEPKIKTRFKYIRKDNREVANWRNRFE